jgi:hypothetical protein
VSVDVAVDVAVDVEFGAVVEVDVPVGVHVAVEVGVSVDVDVWIGIRAIVEVGVFIDIDISVGVCVGLSIGTGVGVNVELTTSRTGLVSTLACLHAPHNSIVNRRAVTHKKPYLFKPKKLRVCIVTLILPNRDPSLPLDNAHTVGIAAALSSYVAEYPYGVESEFSH